MAIVSPSDMNNMPAFVLDMFWSPKVGDTSKVPRNFKLYTFSSLELDTCCPNANLKLDDLSGWNVLLSVMWVERPVRVH